MGSDLTNHAGKSMHLCWHARFVTLLKSCTAPHQRHVKESLRTFFAVRRDIRNVALEQLNASSSYSKSSLTDQVHYREHQQLHDIQEREENLLT